LPRRVVEPCQTALVHLEGLDRINVAEEFALQELKRRFVEGMISEEEAQLKRTLIVESAAQERIDIEAKAAEKMAKVVTAKLSGAATKGAGATEERGSEFTVAGINAGFQFLEGFQQAIESGKTEDVLGVFLDLIQTILGFVPGGAAIGAVVGGVGGLVRSSVRSGGELHREQQLESRRRGRR
ncbi:MAG: hypothetical protein ACE5EX_01840, partial [Phycisphaerae bacterium]